MNDIRAFRGLRFDETVVGPIGKVVCPPYDVISAVDQINLYGRSPFNAVRLELGLEFPEDDASNNRYTRAARTLEDWLARHAVRPDGEPCIYLYEQCFQFDGRTLTRRGLLANLRLAPWEEGVVLPHEETMAKPKADRLELMRTTACHLSPIFLLFDDPSGEVSRLMASVATEPPTVVADTEDGQTHRLWVLPARDHEDLLSALRTPQLYVADGHHRYETELAYRDERRALAPSDPPDAPYNFGMMLLVDARDPGLVVLPTHRMVRGVDPALLGMLEGALSGSFEIERVPVDGADAATIARELLRRVSDLGQQGPALGFYRSDPGGAVVLRLRDPEKAMASRSGPLLDVDVLQDLLLAPLLGIGPEQLSAGTHVTYSRDAVEAVGAVEKGSAQAAFLLNPTPVEQVLQTARAGGKMPQKSTYFYPKPVTGLVISRV
ncbi:MAG: DUF1015 domain-containing protein [Sphingomonadaceae bacterium]